MSTNTLKQKSQDPLGGFILITIGLFFLLNQLISFGLGTAFLSLLAAIFIVLGIMKEEARLLIPGGIISGVALGALLINSALASVVTDDGGLFMLGFASGWLLIPLLTALFTNQTHRWPLIPAAVISIIGFAVTFGGIWLAILTVIGRGWPLILIGVGIVSIYQAYQSTQNQPSNADWLE